MLSRLIYDPNKKRKLRPKLKFKGWHIFVICRRCGKVINKKFTLFGIFHFAENIFCVDCALEMLMKMFKIYNEKPPEIQELSKEFVEKN